MTLIKLYHRLLEEARIPTGEDYAYKIEVGKWLGRGYGESGAVGYRVYSTFHSNSIETNNVEDLIAKCREEWGPVAVALPNRETPDTDFGGPE